MLWSSVGVVCLLLFQASLGNVTGLTGDCTVDGFPTPDTNFQVNGASFPERNSTTGLQVLIPGAAFTCHGYITNWTALIANYFYRDVAFSIEAQIYFQLWRPDGQGKYRQIGNDVVAVTSQEITQETVDITNVRDVAQFIKLEERVAQGDTRMRFEPGDVLGYFSPGFIGPTLGADLTYRPSPEGSENSVDMFYVGTPRSTHDNQLCEISLCDDKVRKVTGIPQLSVAYEVTAPSDTPNQPGICTTLELEACPVTVTPTSTTSFHTSPASSSLPTPALCTDGNCQQKSSSNTVYIYIIAGIVAFVVIMVIGLIIMFLLCCKFCAYRREQLYKNNQVYASPDEFIQLHEPLPRVPHYTTGNGIVYALPSRDSPPGTQLHEGDSREDFDGSCYASTYQTNGHRHTYHEVSGTPTHHTGNVEDTFSPTVLSRFGSHSSMQSDAMLVRSGRLSSRSSFASVGMNGRRPSMPTHLTSQHSSSHVMMSNQPGRLSRTRLTSASYSSPQFPYNDLFTLEEPPSGHHARSQTLPYSHPEVSPDPPPSMVGSETTNSSSTVRQQLLFHALDEEGFRVPTAEERELYSTTEIYSRLSRPHSRTRDSRDSHDVTFFEQSDIYWEPLSSTRELYNQLAERKYREIQREQIRCGTLLGSGHFGSVHRGEWQVPGGSLNVAVKTLKEGATEEDKVKFLQEAAIMGQFLHPNVVKLHGVVTVGEPLMIVLELLPKGELKKFLRSFQKRSIPPDLPMLFLNFCRQIAVGMNYLANKSFVHRDLAARNIFLTEDLTCKIGDFGMARDLSQNDIYHSQGGKVPLKWTAPEALNFREYSMASDVWSYGMVLFEIWSLGRKPFEKVTVSKLVSVVSSGHCQAPPPGCPRAFYQLMVQCWHPVASNRPSFSDITSYLQASSEVLLNWASTDCIVSRRVTELGAPLLEARNLYPDLQYTYDTS